MYNSAGGRIQKHEGWRARAFEIQHSYWGRWPEVSYKNHAETIAQLKSQLDEVRNKCRIALDKISVEEFEQESNNGSKAEFAELMKSLSLNCSTDMIDFAGKIMAESFKLLKIPPPCDFFVLAIGSLARGEATPYSDLEYLFLVDEKSQGIEEYFENLAMTSYFLIGNLGETTLEYMNIAELKDWFSDKAISGFKIDGLQVKAGNIPTGNGLTETTNRFIVTASELVLEHERILFKPDASALKGDLTAMLKFIKVVYHHDNMLNNNYDHFLHSISQQPVPDRRNEVNKDMLKADAKKFNFKPDQKVVEQGFTVDVKKELYRFPSILLLDLSIVLQCSGENAWETADKLLSEGHISDCLHASLKFMLACACYIRLSAYLYHDSHNDRVSVAPKSFTLSKGNDGQQASKRHRKWCTPGGLYLAFCETSMPIKQRLSVLLSDDEPCNFSENLRSLEVAGKPWRFTFFSLYSAGRFMDALDLFGTAK